MNQVKLIWLSPDSVDYLDYDSVSGLNLYAYCNNNPVMYFDGDGHIGIFLTLLFSTLVGAAIGAGVNFGKQLILNGNYNINWWDVAAADLTGAATGLAYGLGGVAGGIVKGSIATIGQMSISQSVGVLVGTALVTNFAAGMGVYALREAGNENTKFNFGMMMSGAFGQMFKGGLSFAMGGIMTGSGLWKIGKNGKNSPINFITRGIGKATSTIIPNMIIDNIFNNF